MYRGILDSTKKIFSSKFIRNLILIIAGVLLIFDVILVIVSELPTISQTIVFSSLKWMVVTYIFGLAISNIFFLRIVDKQPNRILPLIVLSLTSIFLICLGINLHNSSKYDCTNYQNFEKEKFYFTYLVCNEEPVEIPDNVKDPVSFIRYNSVVQNCKTLNCLENNSFRVDLSVLGKIILLIFGILSGHFLWPEYRESNVIQIKEK